MHDNMACTVSYFSYVDHAIVDVIYQTRNTVFHRISNTEKRVENTTHSGVLLMNFKVFDIVMKHYDDCLI